MKVLAFLIAHHALSADEALGEFRETIRPILQEYCFDCHGDGANKGGVSFDKHESDAALVADAALWWKALKNVRADIMPPAKKPQLPTDQKLRLDEWIKTRVFRTDPANLDPGKVTVRRLNRVEYRNTIRDLLGVEIDTESAFPPDDASHGFDNIGSALNISPMLLEKYLAAAQEAAGKAVPAAPRVPAENVLKGGTFLKVVRDEALSQTTPTTNPPATSKTGQGGDALSLSYYQAATAERKVALPVAGRYQIRLRGAAVERHVENQNDYNRCRFTLRVGGREVFSKEWSREGNKPIQLEFEEDLPQGEIGLECVVTPLTPDQKQVRSLALRIDAITLRGPMAEEHWVPARGYSDFFPREVPPETTSRRAYARELLEPLARRAWRRPPGESAMLRLVELAAATWEQSGKTFEAGIGQALTAILASPRFIFREEVLEPAQADGKHPQVDQFSLATRLSYFLWSSMPDDELFKLAESGKLRGELRSQTDRMLRDRKSEAFFRNFTGQWLQTRDIETVIVDARQVLQREAPPDPDGERRRRRFRELRDRVYETLNEEEKKELDEIRAAFGQRFRQPLRAELTGEIRRAMRLETEKTIERIFREDRSLLEVLDSNYTYLNEALARHYGLTNLGLKGAEMRLVELPEGTPRGGVLTQGSVLAVTSNPTRTSPVKRGVFVLENLLGTPPAPPPPDIPPLEESSRGGSGSPLSLRQTLTLHREQPLCASCHNRMDPLGLAMENFNAMGMWREQERGQALDASGTLITGESFTNVLELKRVLVQRRSPEFFHTVAEKLLTYALGRGVEHTDTATLDLIAGKLKAAGGKPSVLLSEVIDSAPFQRSRATSASTAQPRSASLTPVSLPADLTKPRLSP